MPAAFAAAVDSSMFAPFSLARRRLMIDANPIFFSSGIAFDVVAPAHAIVVSSALKLVTPSTVFSVTCCAKAAAPIESAASVVATESETVIRTSARMMLRNAPVAPPAQKFHRSAVVQPQDQED